MGRLSIGCSLAVALPLWVGLWDRAPRLAILQYVLTTVLIWAGAAAERLTIDRIVALVRDPLRDAVRTVFVGTPEGCRRVAGSGAFSDSTDFRLSGFVDVSHPPAPDAHGSLRDVASVIHRTGAEAVVICGQLPDADFEQLLDLSLATGCRLMLAPMAIKIGGITPSVVWRSGEPVVELTAPTLRGHQLLLKRVLDVVVAGTGVVLGSPVFALVALAVRLDSPGLVFFTQSRVGQGGRVFRIARFRTMQPGAESLQTEMQGASIYEDARLFKVVDDPRTTRIGRWLRRTSLDELPQLWNVLMGDMSLVGPRPPMLSEVALYEKHHYGRFDVKPGISGPWQVSGRNQIVDFEDVIRIETAYIRRWSILSDVVILFRTIPAVLGMRGAH